MSRTLTFVSLIALGAALVGGAMAQTDTTTKHGHGRHFATMDANSDGALDKSEAKGRLAERFDETDTNKDGRITKEEMRAGWQARRAGHQADRIARVDTDKDGKVSWAETQAGAKARFDEADTNKDGYLDTSEMGQRRKGWRHHRDDTTGR